MREEEKEITKYKEQGRGKKKKHQIAAEPEKYHIEEDKMIGSPDMLSDKEKKHFLVNAFARRMGLCWLLSVLILPFGSLLALGFANVFYGNYVLGNEFNKMLDAIYRPFAYTAMVSCGVLLLISWLVYHFVYSDNRRLIIRANDHLVEKDIEPVLIPRRDGDKINLVSAFYKLKPPYIIAHIIPVICAILLVFITFVVMRSAMQQKVITDEARKDVKKEITEAFDGYKLKESHKVMAFVERNIYHIGDHAKMTIDIDENGRVLDSSYMVRFSAVYPRKDLDKLKSKGVLKEMQDIYARTKKFKDLFYYPEVTDVPVEFSDYMVNYIDNIREKSKWSKGYEHKAGDHTYITHCKVSYDEGKSKAEEDDKMKIVYHVQQKDFERTKW